MAERRERVRGVLESFGVPANIIVGCSDENLDALISQGYSSGAALECASWDSMKQVLAGYMDLADAIMAAKGVSAAQPLHDDVMFGQGGCAYVHEHNVMCRLPSVT